MACFELRIEDILIQVRSALTDSGIKLWLSPYYIENIGPSDDDLLQLANNFSAMLNVPTDLCLAAISELQNNAIDKLKAREEFNETGVATLKVRVPDKKNGTKLLTIKQKLSDLASDLQSNLAEKLKVPSAKIKLICSGQVLGATKSLEEQGICNNQQLMALILKSTPEEAVQDGSFHERVKSTKEDAALLLDQDQFSDFLHMEDQEGNAIHLPANEKKAVMMALAIHEKGKAALKKEQYNEALVLLLEADQEYKQCTSRLLETVDNYALLNLDIVWCYLQLKSIMQLHDAERRLEVCEKHFRKSYGENMSRVEAIKGYSGNESCLIMRLHILKAVIYFHQNKRSEATNMFCLAESELRKLKVDDNSMQLLIEMGYSPIEARIGLRTARNNLDQAITSIIEKRKTREEARNRAREETRLKKLLGKKSADVNPRHLHLLSEMGYKIELAALALNKTENDITKAINMLQEEEDKLNAELINTTEPSNDLVEQMVQLGFDSDIVRMALKNNLNDMNRAVEMLLKLQNDGNYETAIASLLGSSFPTSLNTNDVGAGPSNSSTPTNKNEKSPLEVMKAYERFSEDVDDVDDNYLDFSLIDEENILREYKSFLNI